jgi:hypothetical protein
MHELTMTETTHELSEMWDWGFGTSSDRYYDYWAYHRNDEYEVHVWWDEGSTHSVEVISIEGYDRNDDPIRNVEVIRQFDSEDEAIEGACDLMEEYV